MRLGGAARTAILVLGGAQAFQPKGDEIKFFHWNPHWQCFENKPGCTTNATDQLTSLLSNGVDGSWLDFANIVEFESASYKPPAGWAAIALTESCGRDWDTLFYNTRRWGKLVDVSGCITPAGSRSWAAGVFQSVGDPGLVITVVGAHYPQTINASDNAYAYATSNLSSALLKMPYTTARAKTVFMADTNTESPTAAAATPGHQGVNKTNAQMLADLGLWKLSAGQPPAAPLFKGCCYNDDFSWEGDRIIANFGSVVSSKVLFDPAPEWASFPTSEFHKGVALTLQPTQLAHSVRRLSEVDDPRIPVSDGD